MRDKRKTQDPMAYRPDIDGLRAIAVLLVLVFHFDLFSIGKGGFIGVDVFFVISGFLITSIIVKDMDAGRFGMGGFLYRRVRRLYPALLATLGLSLLAGYVLFLPDRFEELARETVYSLLYVINFYLWQNVNYFGLQAGQVPLLHMWSLAVEEQFYVLFPLALLLVHRWIPRRLMTVVATVMLASFALGVVASAWKPVPAFYLLPTRAWELLLGAMLALAVRHGAPQGRWLHLMGPLGLGLIGLAIWLYSPLTPVPGWFALLPTLGAFAIILGGYRPAAPVTQLLSLAPVVWIGRISYPLYLVHWPVRVLLQNHVMDYTLGWRIAGFVLSFVLAALIYAVVETPIRRGRVMARPSAYVTTATVASLCLLALAAMTVRSDGLPSRFPAEVSRILAHAGDLPEDYDGCEYTAGRRIPACPIGDRNAPESVLVIGDSHARAFAGALDIWLEAEGKGGALTYSTGCLPVLRTSARAKCRDYVQQAVETALARPEVEEVVLVSIWLQALPGPDKVLDGRLVPEKEVPEVIARLMEETLTPLFDAGKRVTIVDPFFAAPRDVPATLAGNLAFGRDWPVTRPLDDYHTTFESLFKTFARLEGPLFRRVSLIGPFCETGTCRAEADGRPLFTDSNHLAYSQSALLGKILIHEARPWSQTAPAQDRR